MKFALRKKMLAGGLGFMLMLTSLPVQLLANEAVAAAPSQMVPLRAAAEGQGATVGWDGETGSITIHGQGFEASVKLNSTEAMLNGQAVSLAAAPAVNDFGRTLIDYSFIRPLFVSENDPHADMKDTVIPTIYQYMEANQIAGMTMALVDLDQKAPWLQGFGYEDVTAAQVVTKDTAFEIGSISKTFTAMGIMQLVEQGKVNLDEKVVTYLPDFSALPHPDRGGSSADITIRMLGQHTSGILGTYAPRFFSYDPSNAQLMNTLDKDLGQTYLNFAPQDSWSYSNTAISLLGVVIPAVASPGQNYLDGFNAYMQENIFMPLGMQHSAFVPEATIHESKSYVSAGMEDLPTHLSVVPAGTMRSTSDDMAHYITALLSGGVLDGNRVLSEESINTMLTSQSLVGERTFDQKMGFVWMPFEFANRTLWLHDGVTRNFYSILVMDRESGLGVFVSSNTTSGGTGVSNLGIYALQMAIAQKTGVTMVFKTYGETAPATEVDQNLLKSYTGTYGAVGMNITATANGLQYSVMGQTGEFILQNDGTFMDASDGRRYFFQELSDGNMIIGYYNGVNRVYLFDRITATHPELAGKFIGKWTYIDAESDLLVATLYGQLEIAVVDDNPVMISGGVPIILIFIDETTAYIPGYARGQGDTLKLIQENGQTYLMFMGAKYILAAE